jgi:hypothetical protein
MAIELVPLCTMRIQAKPPVEVGAGPAGCCSQAAGG